MNQPVEVLCGDLGGHGGRSDGKTIRLSTVGSEPSVTLDGEIISDKAAAVIPDRFLDLLEIAAYVYSADQTVTRGGRTDPDMGAHWRRNFQFKIPVRDPVFWASPEVMEDLTAALAFLSEDNYSFEFSASTRPQGVQHYLGFRVERDDGAQPESVCLFSGGLDSLAGAVQETITEGRAAVLVSHRSNSILDSRQRRLVLGLRSRGARVNHVPVWINKDRDLGREYTQRARSFMYLSLAAVVAHAFGLRRINVFENGVTSLNLAPLDQLVGARATRTTHPGAIARFRRLATLVAGYEFTIATPFIWKTKADIVTTITTAGCNDLIEASVSCSRSQLSTMAQPHCGECMQCIERRLAILAAGAADDDPDAGYHVDLFRGPRSHGDSITMVEALVAISRDVMELSEVGFRARFPMIYRAIPHIPGAAPDVEHQLFLLHRARAEYVIAELDKAIQLNSRELANGSLPNSCLLRMSVAGGPGPTRNVIQRRAQGWFVSFGGEPGEFFRDCVGLEYVALLIRERPRVFRASELVQLFSTPAVDRRAKLAALLVDDEDRGVQFGRGGGELLIDDRARAEYKKEIVELDAEIADAESKGDPVLLKELLETRAKVYAALEAATARRGKPRKRATGDDRNRQAVASAIRKFVGSVPKQLRAFSDNLRGWLRFGAANTYSAPETVRWDEVSDPFLSVEDAR